LKLGIAGLGTVGSCVARLIERERDALAARCGRTIEVVAVSARSRSKKRDIGRRKLRWVDDPLTLATDSEIDVFVELMGGEGDPAKAAISAALGAKKSVVTANKALLARHGVALAAIAEKNRVALNFEAAVGGAIPIVKTLREGLAGNSLARVYGILNGTCNYILTRMEEERLAFAACLKEAQRLGYAEADPTFDIEGHDTAQKLAILASLAFGTKVDQSAVYVEGISSITPEDLEWADELGYRVKLLGVALKTEKGIEQRVHPTMVPKDTPIAQVMGVTNAVTVDVDAIAPITLVGPAPVGWRRPPRLCRTSATLPAACARRHSGGLQRGWPRARRRRCSATKAATTFGFSPWTSRAPPRRLPGGWRSRTSHSNRSCSAAAASRRTAARSPAARERQCR
jgi:homoserine dehydrogenase